jgi:23S rRNA pseudouridine1911/1915/1917 synthase
MGQIVFLVSKDQAGTRLDVFLTHHLPHETRSTIQKWIRQCAVTVNGRESKSAHRLQCKDRIEIDKPESHPKSGILDPWEYPLTLLYEDEDLLAINKPSRLVTHPGAGRSNHTLANALIFLRQEIRNVGHPLRPGIVHRLDQETSGILLVAKNEQSYLALSAMFKERKIEKHYRALAYGKMRQNEGKIDHALGRDPKDRKKISVRARQSRSAVTIYRVLKQYDFAALLDVRIVTGRTHQIRVHLTSEGHPLVGDSKYGGGNWNRISDLHLRNAFKQAGFFGLHALSLDFRHPSTGVAMHLEAPLPASWELLP